MHKIKTLWNNLKFWQQADNLASCIIFLLLIAFFSLISYSNHDPNGKDLVLLYAIVPLGITAFALGLSARRQKILGAAMTNTAKKIRIAQHNRFWRLLAGPEAAGGLPADESVESQFAQSLRMRHGAWRGLPSFYHTHALDCDLIQMGALIYAAIHAERPQHQQFPGLNQACGQVVYNETGFDLNFLKKLAHYSAQGLSAVLLPETQSATLMRPATAGTEETLLRPSVAQETSDSALLLRANDQS